MRVDRQRNVFHISAHLERQYRFGQEFAGVDSDDACTEQPLGLRIVEELGETVVAADGQRPAARRPA